MTDPDYREKDPAVLAVLPLDRLEAEISRCLLGYQTGGTSQGRKAFFKRLVMLEDIREETHGIPAKRRTFSGR